MRPYFHIMQLAILTMTALSAYTPLSVTAADHDQNNDQNLHQNDGNDDVKALFQVPPHGKPELLLKGSKLEGPTAMAFDSRNRPYLINNRNPESFGKLHTIRDGQWVTHSLRNLFDKASLPTERESHAIGELVIDDKDCLYATLGGKLIYSADLGRTFSAYPCTGSLELRVGPNRIAEPPAICLIPDHEYIDRAEKESPELAWWAKKGTLSILLPRKEGDRLILGDPILISDNCLAAGSGGHSGGTSFAVTLDGKTHIVYAELPKAPRTGGNPIFIATVDRASRTVVSKQFLVTANPVKADVHTRPTIALDGKGYLHVLTGSHGMPIFYLRSLKPGTITEGWSKPAELSGRINPRVTYASIVCDQKDRLHTVYREFMPHPTLAYSLAEAHTRKWHKPRTLVNGANRKGSFAYGIFYHRLFIDRANNLYLNFTFWEVKTNDQKGYPEALIVSEDGGQTWHLNAEQVLMDALN